MMSATFTSNPRRAAPRPLWPLAAADFAVRLGFGVAIIGAMAPVLALSWTQAGIVSAAMMPGLAVAMALDARGITRLLIRLGILAIGFAVTFIPVGLIVGWGAAGTYLVAAALLTIINSLVVAKLAAPSEPRQG